jgi:glycosyltransferase involved in cell wall biosynthesis
MRFLILSQYFPPEIGATQTRLAALARELMRLGNRVEIVTAMPNHPTGRIFQNYRGRFYLCEEWEGAPVHRVWVYASLGKGLRRLVNYASFILTSLVGLAKAERPDIIFVESPPPFLAIPAVLAARLRGVPVILNVADLWPDAVREFGVLQDGLVMRIASALERWAYRNADFINALSDGIWMTLVHKKSVPARKLLRLYNGADTKLFHPGPPDLALKRSLGLEEHQIVLYQGTLGYAHAVENSLRAAQLLSDNRRIHFIFLGDGSEKLRLMELATELSLRNVTFLDIVPVEWVPRYLSIACCGLVTLKDLPLLSEMRLAKIPPILACGKPVVFSGPEGEASKMLREAGAGIITPADNPEALATAVQEIADHPEIAQELGKNGRRYVERHLTWSHLVANWLAELTERQNLSRMRTSLTFSLGGSSAGKAPHIH